MEFIKNNCYNSKGTRIFLQNTSFFAVGSNNLLKESAENKQIVKQAFMAGLSQGVIKTFPSHVLTTSLSDSSMFDMMR